MSYCHEKGLFCEFARASGYCTSTGCNKLTTVTYEIRTMTPATNADHIRSMTDEELADYMSEHSIEDFCYIICGGECKAIASFTKTPFQRCREIVSDWLKQPFEEVRK